MRLATLVALVGSLAFIGPTADAPALALGGDCSGTSVGLTPLSDGVGLYEDGNEMPAPHAARAPDVVPVGGVIGVVSLGMSNGSQEWARFMDVVAGQPFIAPSLRFADGAIGGEPMMNWADPAATVWNDSVARIQGDGLLPAQVQVVWMKMGSRLGELPVSQAARIEQERQWLRSTIANAAAVFPNLKRIYISARIYAGYEDSVNHAEPQTGYDNGLAVRALVADAVAEDTAIWTGWGPYLWADGLTPRRDGLIWQCSDFEDDGVHPSASGEQKVADQLLDFFSSEPTACEWFLRDQNACGTIVGNTRFGDVPATHPFFADIEWLAESGITLGCNPPANSLFCPRANVTRGQMAAFLDRALDLPPGPDAFQDDGTSVFETNINALAAAGITIGCNPPANTWFCPGANVTRGQMAAFLVRALGLPPGPERFRDDDTSVFEVDINALAAAGITLGCNPPSNDLFCPDALVTRAQMAAFLHRAEPHFG